MGKDWRDAGTAGERLRWAVENHQRPEGKRRGIGLLIQKLEDAGVKGATYPSIGGYLKDAPTAPLDFLRAAANALDVDEAWLILGRGAPTTPHAKVKGPVGRGAVVTAETSDWFAQNVMLQQAVHRAMGLPPVAPRPSGGVPPYTAPLCELWVRLTAATMKPGRVGVIDATLEDRIGEALNAPLAALGLDPRQMYQDGTLGDYILGVVPALLVAARSQSGRDNTPSAAPKARRKSTVRRK